METSWTPLSSGPAEAGRSSLQAGMAARGLPVAADARRVRLCFVSYRQLSALAARLIPDYAPWAEIESVDAAFDTAIEIARARAEHERVDAFVSAGSNAALLRSALASPVATIKIDGYDMLLALRKASAHADCVGVATFGDTITELEAVKSMLNLRVMQCAYHTEAEARRCLINLRQQGCGVIVGSSIVVELAGQLGMHGILAYSERSVRQGIEDAIDMAQVAQWEVARYLRRQRHAQAHWSARHEFRDLVGESPSFMQAVSLAREYAAAEGTVMIHGETGTGKEWFAQAIHNASRRSGHPFVPINCAALPDSLLESELFGYEEGAFTGSRRGGKKGLLELAQGGTLFLDEIADMPLSMQARLLRVLQERQLVRLGGERPVNLDIRVIAASHQPLRARAATGQFRADLYYRLNTLPLDIPPLRHRAEDLARLAESFLVRRVRQLRLALNPNDLLTPLLPVLRRHEWPGNVRELESLCEWLLVRVSKFQSPREIPFTELREQLAEVLGASSGMTAVAELDDIEGMLARCGGNRAEAARRLGISRATLWRRLRQRQSAEPQDRSEADQ